MMKLLNPGYLDNTDLDSSDPSLTVKKCLNFLNDILIFRYLQKTKMLNIRITKICIWGDTKNIIIKIKKVLK